MNIYLLATEHPVEINEVRTNDETINEEFVQNDHDDSESEVEPETESINDIIETGIKNTNYYKSLVH
jgi:hypothetical protein